MAESKARMRLLDSFHSFLFWLKGCEQGQNVYMLEKGYALCFPFEKWVASAISIYGFSLHQSLCRQNMHTVPPSDIPLYIQESQCALSHEVG